MVSMAEIIDKMPTSRSVAGRPNRYNWAELLDGLARRLTAEEFSGTPADFGRQVRRAARKRRVDVHVVTRSSPPTVYVKAAKP